MTKLDNVIVDTLKKSYDNAKNILSENIEALHKLSAYLLEKETITGKEFMSILNDGGTNNEELLSD